MRTLILLTLVFGVLLIACGEAGGDVARELDVATPPATVGIGSGSVDPTPDASTGTPLPRRIVGSMTCAGGLASISPRKTVVYADGTVTIRESGPQDTVVHARTSKGQVQWLQAAFASSEWQELDATYGKDHPDSSFCTVVGGGKKVVSINRHGPPILSDVQHQFIRIQEAALRQ